MRCPVTVEEKGNAPWADDVTRRTSYTKRVFPPRNMITMGRRSISVSPLEIGSKHCITTDILSPICDLETKPLYLNIFGTLEPKGSGANPQIKWKIIRQSSTATSFNGRCNLCIDEKISKINFKDRRQLLNERNELVSKCRHKIKFKLS